MKKIGVIGSGTMGNGIAQVSASSGHVTYLLDLNQDILQKGFEKIKKNLERELKKRTIKQLDVNGIMDNINLITDYACLSQCDLIIEAAIEKQSIKENIFLSLDNISNENTILATNTSSISIDKLAEITTKPEKVIGMHFMNPVSIMKLVEVIKGRKTDAETISKIIDLSEKMGKIPIECNDSPGFISNRILMPMINEAIYCLMEGGANANDIDEIMKLGMGHPMGPLALADLIGLDVCLSICEVLHEDFGEDKYRPCPLLKRMVSAGMLGRKTGNGFYNYKN